MRSCLAQAESETLSTRIPKLLERLGGTLGFYWQGSVFESRLGYWLISWVFYLETGRNISLRLPTFHKHNTLGCRSQLQRGLRCGSAASRLLGSRVRISPGPRKSVSSECYVCCQIQFSATGRSLVKRSLAKYDVSGCDRGTLWRNSRLQAAVGPCKKKLIIRDYMLLTDLSKNKQEKKRFTYRICVTLYSTMPDDTLCFCCVQNFIF